MCFVFVLRHIKRTRNRNPTNRRDSMLTNVSKSKRGKSEELLKYRNLCNSKFGRIQFYPIFFFGSKIKTLFLVYDFFLKKNIII